MVWMRAFLTLPLERVSGQCHDPSLERVGGVRGGINRYLQVGGWAGSVAGLGAWNDMHTPGSRFTTGLRSRIFGCKSNRRKTSTI